VNVKVLVKDLKPGMFVAELDRPWLDTPFLLQGFLLDNNEDMAEIRRLCRHVFVDPDRSAPGAVHHLPKPAATEAGANPTETLMGSVIRHEVHAKPVRGDGGEQSKAPRAPGSPERQPRSGSAAEHLIIYEQQRQRARNLADPTKSRKWEVDMALPLDTVASLPTKEQGPKKAGLLKGLMETLRGRVEEETPPEPPKAPEELQLVYARPLVRVDGYRVVHDEELLIAKEIHARTKELIRGIVEDIRRDRQLDLEKASDVVDEMVESVNRSPDALMWLTKLKSRDSYAYDHGIDVAIHMVAFGRHLGFPKETLHILGLAGLMQDIGKLRLPEELLRKPGKLTSNEFVEMQSHVGHSIEILRQTRDLPVLVLDTVSQHHERLDGSGYPARLQGDKISTFGAMAGIVDSYEALTSDRPYAPAMSTHQALQQLHRWKSAVFHDGLTDQFIQCIGIFPVGSLIELNTGDVAVVVAQNKIRRLKPKIMLVLDPEKKAYRHPAMLELIYDPKSADDVPYQIKRDLPVGAYNIDPQEYYL
jgi:HD-GYP domain-containing protein (c-di-GMP phosphodiesterase class II)